MWRYLEAVKEPAPKKPKTNAERLETPRSYEKEKLNRQFQDDWAKIWFWLPYDEEKKLIVYGMHDLPEI